MFILDSLLIGGLRFVLDKVALAADAEMNDEAHLTEALLEEQTRLESGEISKAQYQAFERDILKRLSLARRRRQEEGEAGGEQKVTGADVRMTDGRDE